MIARIDELRHAPVTYTRHPQLLGPHRLAYDQICARLTRARKAKRRAERQGDEKKLTAATHAIAQATGVRDALLAPAVGHLWAPARIIAKLERPWRGRSGTGIHRHVCEMVLDHKDLPGPEYRTVRVLIDEGGPPARARLAPDKMGIAWSALADQIRCGRIVVLCNEEPS